MSLILTPQRRALRKTSLLRRDFSTPSAFLTSLPSLASHFAVDADPWPRFSDALDDAPSDEQHENGLIDGVAGALEVGLNVFRRRSLQIIYSSSNAQAPSRALASVSPSSAEQLLSSIYTYPGTSYSPSYLVIIGGTAHSGGVSSNLDGELDGTDWDALEKRCKECDVRVSCVCTGERSAAERLRRLVETASPGGSEDPWFATPPDTQVFLSGLAIDPGEFPFRVPRLTRSNRSTITSATPGCSICSG